MPIDTFFYSLAQSDGRNSIGVVLSGTGMDGTLGLQAIKAEDGLTFAEHLLVSANFLYVILAPLLR